MWVYVGLMGGDRVESFTFEGIPPGITNVGVFAAVRCIAAVYGHSAFSPGHFDTNTHIVDYHVHNMDRTMDQHSLSANSLLITRPFIDPILIEADDDFIWSPPCLL